MTRMVYDYRREDYDSLRTSLELKNLSKTFSLNSVLTMIGQTGNSRSSQQSTPISQRKGCKIAIILRGLVVKFPI